MNNVYSTLPYNNFKQSEQFNIFDYTYKPEYYHSHKDEVYTITKINSVNLELSSQLVTLLMLLFDDMQFFLINPHPEHDIQQTYNYILYTLEQLSQSYNNHEIIISLINLLKPYDATSAYITLSTHHFYISRDIFHIISLALPNHNYTDYLYALEMHIYNIENTLTSHNDIMVLHPYFSQTIHIYKHTAKLLRIMVYQDFYQAFLLK